MKPARARHEQAVKAAHAALDAALDKAAADSRKAGNLEQEKQLRALQQQSRVDQASAWVALARSGRQAAFDAAWQALLNEIENRVQKSASGGKLAEVQRWERVRKDLDKVKAEVLAGNVQLGTTLVVAELKAAGQACDKAVQQGSLDMAAALRQATDDYTKTRQFARAEAAQKEVLALRQPYLNRGAHFLERKNYAEACTELGLAIQILPDHREHTAKVCNERGVAFYALKEHAKALADFTAAIDLDEEYAVAWYNRAKVQFDLGAFQSCIDDCSRVVKIARKEEQKQLGRAWFLRARAHAELGGTALSPKWWSTTATLFKECVDDCTEAVKFDPANAQIYLTRARAYSKLPGKLPRKLTECIADCTKTIELDPKNVDAYFLRAGARADLGQFQQCVQDCTRIIEFQENNAAAYRMRANAYASMNDEQKSKADYARAAELEKK